MIICICTMYLIVCWSLLLLLQPHGVRQLEILQDNNFFDFLMKVNKHRKLATMFCSLLDVKISRTSQAQRC